MKIRIINSSQHKLPSYATVNSAGMDLCANLMKPVSLKPMERILIGTGLFIELPVGYEAQIRPRSGLAIRRGLTVLNTPGTIDADYRGEIKVILINLSNKNCLINNGDKICQMIISKYENIQWEEVNEINNTGRGSGGFGHTGV
jgi:dUTP pyrophosphatase